MQEEQKSSTGRRTFLKAGATAAVGLSALQSAKAGRVVGANDRVRVAVVGLRGRGWDHVEGYKSLPNVQLAAFCDIDDSVLRKRCGDAEKMGIDKPTTYTDVRKLLESKDIDAISIATPNHWHSLMGIWAAQAGKDFYIEKPCSHNYWEGRQLVDAVAKYKVIAQHGSQCRSSAAIREAMQNIQSGLIGDPYMSRGLCFKWRVSIGHADPSPVPEGVNYDLWTGPAPMKPFTKNRFHYNWHWIWDTGNGDIGNQGIHQIDLARWGLGVKLPTKITAMGAHFLFDDDQQTPNVLTAAYEFKTPGGATKMMSFEVRGWMTNHEAEIGSKDFMGGGVPAAGLDPGSKKKEASPKAADKLGPPSDAPSTIGNMFYGPKGYIAISNYDTYRSFLGETNEPGPKSHVPLKYEHYHNFVDCIRSRKAEELHSPVIEGHTSAALVHLANASYRLGRTLNFDPETETVIDDAEANTLLKGSYRAPFVVPQQV